MKLNNTMKRKMNLSLICFLIYSISYAQITEKDLYTGATCLNNGLSAESIVMEINEEAQITNTFPFGDKIKFIFEDVKGLKEYDKKVFPGISILILENKKDTILKKDDLLTDDEGIDIPRLRLSAHFQAIMTNNRNNNYEVHIKIWDKKGDGVLHYRHPFSVIPNKELLINNQNLTFESIYLWNDSKKSIITKNIHSSDKPIILIDGLSGLTAENNHVFPAIFVEIEDNNGKKLVYEENVMSEVAQTDLDPEALKNGQIPVSLSIKSAEISNPCKLRLKISDLKSDNYIQVESELEISTN